MHRPRTFVWYFLALLLLGVLAVVAPIIVNLRQQLTPEQAGEARARWNQQGPASYDLRYLERMDEDEIGDVYEVKVRGGEVVALRINKRLIALEALTAEQRQRYTVPGLFDQIEAHLGEQKEGKRLNFATAHFDAARGSPTHYVRRVRGSRSRLEWLINVTPVSE